ncbi:MAG: DUF3501 family protein [Acidimicrobiia bacterium]|jgi:hypothetical protein|nr:DUF3501 family protein [Acidimicrobiia bacterium]MBP8181715.1 DUF3501 family protein [Acidimicrobiia bacterium]
MTRHLSLDDISDHRQYERERADFRAHVIALKADRRIDVGPYVSLVFENRDTIRFQIQEMARAERILTDEGIEHELAVYNPLIPQPGHLSATLFIQLTDKDALMEWLPKLVGIETSVGFRFGDRVVKCNVDPEHASQLTRDDVTASVHYIGFTFTEADVADFSSRPVVLFTDHPEYAHAVELSRRSVEALVEDLVPDSED